MNQKSTAYIVAGIVAVFIINVTLLITGIARDYNRGPGDAEKLFNELSGYAGSLLRTTRAGSPQFLDNLQQAYHLPEEVASLTIETQGQVVYRYPSTLQLNTPATSPFIKTYSVHIGSPDNAILVTAQIAILKSSSIFMRSRFAFIFILIGTITAAVMLICEYKFADSDDEYAELHFEKSPSHEPNVAVTAEASDEVHAAIAQAEFDLAPDEDIPLEKENDGLRMRSAPETPAVEEAASVAPVTAPVEQATPATAVPPTTVPANQEQPVAEPVAPVAPQPAVQAQPIIEQTPAPATTAVPVEEETDDDDTIEVIEEADEPVEDLVSEDEVTDFETVEEPQVPAATPEQQQPAGLFSPVTGFGWESYLITRLDSELIRAASSEQDVALFIIQIQDLDRTNNALIKQISDLLVDTFNFPDMVFEYKNNGFAAIKVDETIDTAINLADDLYASLKTLFKKNNYSASIAIGLSARSVRIISADRLLNEASQAAEHAKEDPSSPIIAFRVNPEKYRQYLAQNLNR